MKRSILSSSITLNVALFPSIIRAIMSYGEATSVINQIYALPDTLLELEIAESVPWTKESFGSFLENHYSYVRSNQTGQYAYPEKQNFNQLVYVDFNNPNTTEEAYMFQTVCQEYNASFVSSFPGAFIHTYTSIEQEAIMERITTDFEKFNVTFVLDEPSPSEQEYSTLTFNALNLDGDDVPNLSVSTNCADKNNDFSIEWVEVLYGLADGIDFRNIIHGDNAGIDVNVVEVLGAIDMNFLRSRFDIPRNLNDREAITEVIVKLSARIASHELGHILGLRHHDSFGAIGLGLPYTLSKDDFFPTYDGNQDATEIISHVMATGPVDRSFDSVQNDDFFSERSSIKLSFALNGDFEDFVYTEEDFQSKPEIEEIATVQVPNTLNNGQNSGTEFLKMFATVIRGSISQEGEIDYYRFKLQSGQIFSAEVVSFENYSNRYEVITRLTLYREECDGSLIQLTNNSQAFEGFDPFILDKEVSESGTYVLRVDAPDVYYFKTKRGNYKAARLSEYSDRKNFLIGDYELLIYGLHNDQKMRNSKNKSRKKDEKKTKVKGKKVIAKGKGKGKGNGSRKSSKCKVKGKGKGKSEKKKAKKKKKNKDGR